MKTGTNLSFTEVSGLLHSPVTPRSYVGFSNLYSRRREIMTKKEQPSVAYLMVVTSRARKLWQLEHGEERPKEMQEA